MEIGLPIWSASEYAPVATWTVSPAIAASIAAWMDGYCAGTSSVAARATPTAHSAAAMSSFFMFAPLGGLASPTPETPCRPRGGE
jgi:hypothetical protein